jgi:hypothetical protein
MCVKRTHGCAFHAQKNNKMALSVIEGNLLNANTEVIFVSHNSSYHFGKKGLHVSSARLRVFFTMFLLMRQPALMKRLKNAEKVKIELERYGGIADRPVGSVVETRADGLSANRLLHVVCLGAHSASSAHDAA